MPVDLRSSPVESISTLGSSQREFLLREIASPSILVCLDGAKPGELSLTEDCSETTRCY